MQKEGIIILEDKFLKIDSFDGIDIYHIKTKQFKTNTINVFFQDSLNKNTATMNALIPAILKRGSKNLPTAQDISLYMEELYGAVFDCGVAKKGEKQLMHFYIEFLSDTYIDSNTNLFEQIFQVFFEIITKPVLQDSMFKIDYLDQEKENLKKLIESRINDKVQYAIERCYEEMCDGEPFSVYEYGTITDLENIDNKTLYKHYKESLKTLPIQVFITGDVGNDNIQIVLNRLKELKRENIKNIESEKIVKNVENIKNIVENMEISQGKIALGFRTNIFADSTEYYPLVVFNGILGGGMHSKLFQNIREKESLAYYIFSRIEKFKGLLLISGGIEIENRDKALEIIKQQIEDIKKGNISDYEYSSTLKTIETAIKSLQDSQLQLVDFYLNQTVANTKDNFNTFIENIKKVSKQDITKIAEKIQLDTIYFLTGK